MEEMEQAFERIQEIFSEFITNWVALHKREQELREEIGADEEE